MPRTITEHTVSVDIRLSWILHAVSIGILVHPGLWHLPEITHHALIVGLVIELIGLVAGVIQTERVAELMHDRSQNWNPPGWPESRPRRRTMRRA